MSLINKSQKEMHIYKSYINRSQIYFVMLINQTNKNNLCSTRICLYTCAYRICNCDFLLVKLDINPLTIICALHTLILHVQSILCMLQV